jgi:hypothetical protein
VTVDGVGEQCVCLGVGMESSRFSMHWLDNMLVSSENQPLCMGKALQAHHENHRNCILFQFTCKFLVMKVS